MKKMLLIACMAILMPAMVNAQQSESAWTLNTRGWTTNYFTTGLYDLVVAGVKHLTLGGSTEDSLWVERIIPKADLVFPIGMGKNGFGENDIYGPYHYAFGNPFKHIGDYAIGLDASWKGAPVGFYAGAYFKSQELVFKGDKDNLRGYYFQPRAGLMVGSKTDIIELGAFYDVVTGCSGSVANTDKKQLKGGFGLDFAYSATSRKRHSMLTLMFSMPLHNFFDTDYQGLENVKRRVGYIILTNRIYL